MGEMVGGEGLTGGDRPTLVAGRGGGGAHDVGLAAGVGEQEGGEEEGEVGGARVKTMRIRWKRSNDEWVRHVSVCGGVI
jgi:hypothetical protein